ncbi:MAG: hypothetical protein ACP5NS_02215 [Candidatus Pacearchaeota archaeon]
MIRPILKKGKFDEEVLSAIVAVAGLLLIGFLAVKLYNFFISQDEKNAAAFLDGLKAKIDLLEEGENNTFALRGVKGWVLVAWNKEVISSEKPEKCFDKNCLCLCKDSPTKEACQEDGICRYSDQKLEVKSGAANHIYLASALSEFFINKTSETIIISSSTN